MQDQTLEWSVFGVSVLMMLGSLGLTFFRSGQMIGEAKAMRETIEAQIGGLRAELHGIAERVTKVEDTGRDQGSSLLFVRESVARIEGTLAAEARARRDSDKVSMVK